MIAVFAYAFPHRKTHDFLVELVLAGQRELCVIAAPFQDLPGADREKYFSQTLRGAPARDTADICSALGLEFHEVAHGDAEAVAALKARFGFRMGVISGARILKRAVIELFEEGIVNFHPGKLPETSGLDLFFYSIKHAAPMGVTAHFIDARVDAGAEVFFEETETGPEDTAEAAQHNVYQTQITALRRFLDMLRAGTLAATPVNRPSKNEPMEPAEKRLVLARFPAWRAERYMQKELARLLLACRAGELQTISRILETHPALVNARDGCGKSPLVAASAAAQHPVVELLLARGADPNAAGRDGTTVLMHAVRDLAERPGADLGLLDLLIEAGAEIDRRDSSGRSAVDLAHETRSDDIVAYLRARQGNST